MKSTTYTSEVYPEARLIWPALAIGALGVWLGIHFEIEDSKLKQKSRIPVRAVLVWLAVLAGILLILYFSNHPILNSEVIIYAAQDQVYAEPILLEFEKATGLKVKAVYDSEAVKTV